MAIAPYRTSTELFRPLFEESLAPLSDGNRASGLMRAPLADVVETESEIRVVVEMPGISADQLQVDLENNVLTISGEKKEEYREGDEKSAWHLTERRYGKLSRSFVLPRDVEQESIRAHYESGVLTVTIPKSERSRRRRIEIGSHGEGQKVETNR